MSRRAVTAAGLAAAGGVGYYLYKAGGDPKVAEKKFEADAAKVQAKLKSDLPGREKEFEKKGEAIATQAGQKIDHAIDEVRGKLTEAQQKAQEYKDRTGQEMKQAVNKFDTTIEQKARAAEEYKERAEREMNKAVDNFDKTVERKTVEAKNGISSWFGFGGK
ncbi:hypothetical protein GJ744_012229 [Endocarpon pusillum]|uniref:Uncharacterized protein n=1 Tax=Endocarpon pusillum TaxID=364733 RepID=A0A8H7AC14_9EURO|nr:hypothetical protein GJ744_012229 [Endocarpon pusillum]